MTFVQSQGNRLDTLSNALDSQDTGSNFLSTLEFALQRPRVLLVQRECDTDHIFIAVVDHCARNDEIDAMNLLVDAFWENRDLSKLIVRLKDHLMRNILSRAVISGLFRLDLSDSEADEIFHTAKRLKLIPGMWSKNGLRFQTWINYCMDCSPDEELKRLAKEKLDQMQSQTQSDVIELDKGIISVEVLERLANSPVLRPINQWHSWLTHKDYNIRSAAANLTGVYVASKYQESTLQMLMEYRSKIPLETFLRAVSNSCIRLATLSIELPVKESFEESQIRQQEIVLPLTQHTQAVQHEIISQQKLNKASQSDFKFGPLSYLDCFQGQSLLYIALIDVFKEGSIQSILVAHHFRVIAQSLNKTPWQLCQPFWPAIAPKLLKHYNRKIVEEFCSSVLSVPHTNFLLRTSSITIPHLCVSGKGQLEACKEIAELKGSSVRRLYFNHASAIIAAMLLRSAHNHPSIEDLELAWSEAEERFISLDRSFKTLQLNSYVISWRVDVIYEILMGTNDQNAEVAIGFIKKIMNLVYAEHPNKAEHRELLQQTVFKLIVKFSETMRNLMGRQSLTSKLSVLVGLRIIIERMFTNDLTASVLRQLTAFLQSALDINPLILSALETWFAVAQNLDDTKLEAIIDLTYSFINEKIDQWDQECVCTAKKIVTYIKERISKEPTKFEKIHPQSAFDVNSLNEIDAGESSKSVSLDDGSSTDFGLVGHSSYDILLSLVERDTENMYTAKQTARDLCAFGLEFQSEIIGWAKEDGAGHELLGRAVRVLLNLCGKDEVDLQKTSVRALGLFGALDSHKISIEPRDPPLIIVSNFHNFNEVISLCKVLVQDWFLPAFEAAIDPDTQRYFSYGIQELLKFMSAEDKQSLKAIFKDDGLASTLLPLLKTKYTTEMKHWKPAVYPIYKIGKPYNEWLVSFCSDMMSRTLEPEYATTIFSWCLKVLYGSSAGPEMWSYLLPYASLAAVVDPREATANREVFLKEVLFVLSLSGEMLQSAHEQIFAVVDYFNQWMRSRRQTKQPLLGIDEVLAAIPAKLMAQRALESNAYPRAIRYYEQQLHEDKGSEVNILHNLRHMYGAMQDIDSLEGVSAQMPVLSIEQQVLEYRATSQWDAALACYNALPTSEDTVVATLECLHHSGRDKEVLAELSADSTPSRMAYLGAECAWTVRDWEALNKWTMLIDPENMSHGTSSSHLQPGAIQALGSALLALKERDWVAFKVALETGRQHIGSQLGEIVNTHQVTSLRQVRDLMVYLHGLADVESLGTIIMPDFLSEDDLKDEGTVITVRKHLDQRLGVLSTLNEGPEFQAKRFLLYLRAAALSCISGDFPGSKQLVADAHLEVSRTARNHGQHSIALMEIAIAKQLDNSQADVEQAKLLWSQGESRAAIRMMQSQIDPDFFSTPKLFPQSGILALEWTVWRDMGAQADTKVIVENYMTVIKSLPGSSEAQYRLAKHHVKIYDELTPKSRSDGVTAKAIVHHYSKALLLGTPHYTEALPKMLTTWLDLGIMPSETTNLKSSGITGQLLSTRRHNLGLVNKEIVAWGQQIDRKMVYTAIPQLLSRLNHPSGAVQKLIEQLIIPVLQLFPHHCLWYVLEKGDQTKGIIKEASLKTKNKQSLFTDLVFKSQSLVDKLKIICNTRLKQQQREVKLSDFGQDFKSCLNRPLLAVPIQKNMDSLEDVLIYEIDSRVIVQQSMQRPKRVNVWGNDGKSYQLLLKGQDDARKDARLIEFTSAVNQLLRSDAAAAARHLNILNYRVTPLSDRAGIIEWVAGALPARLILRSLSRRPDLGTSSPQILKVIKDKFKPNFSQKLDIYNELTKVIPPVLWEWFVDTFPDPEAWLSARTRYARSLAVMSMVGYILGLGDRHLENILLLQNSGSVLHVDFDCLFDKGKRLTVPELVPFRLTQQFRDALGAVNGYEGPFRKVSELTLKIMRSNEDLLMVVLEAFVHDPVVQDRINNMSPTEALEGTRAKIRGVSESNSASLSVGGMVDELIKTAVSPDLLCQMFHGWLPWV